MTPQASKNSRTSPAIGAAPVSASSQPAAEQGAHLREHQPVRERVLRGRAAGSAPPRRSAARARRPGRERPVEERRACTPPASSTLASACVWIFSNTRGTDGKCVGPTRRCPRAAAAGSPDQKASVPPTSSATICVTRASTCASGRNRKIDGRLAELQRLLVHVERREEVGVREHAALRRPGGARRVDDRRDVGGVGAREAARRRTSAIDLAARACAGRRATGRRRAPSASRSTCSSSGHSPRIDVDLRQLRRVLAR